MIANDDQRALSVLDIDATRSVGKNQSAYASTREHTRRKRNLGRRIALIQMHASLHHRNGHVPGLAKHQPSRVPNRRRTRKRRDVRIRNADRLGEVVGKRSQPRSKNQTDLRAQVRLPKHKRRRRLGATKEIRCHVSEVSQKCLIKIIEK